MHFTTIFATVTAAFAATATALPTERDTGAAVANVIAVNKPLDGTHSSTAVKIPFGKLTHVDLPITNLMLKSVTVTASGVAAPDVSKVTCQMYKDKYGVQPGSAAFNKKHEAYISTNTVQFGWVLCYVNVSPASA
ncbi:hypothetical protein B0J13DRAFT_566710 [Dactylonectria estremocensis]|uniref:Uncharacterized protein n=1 Tax=Dactylonectria estremocensis TaxID=1079267 RepID=A0A9P9IIM1_9HYPO|nr:hypothetical protein B0J13DRAFT_566710 [Dactylonectria estremocensis]